MLENKLKITIKKTAVLRHFTNLFHFSTHSTTTTINKYINGRDDRDGVRDRDRIRSDRDGVHGHDRIRSDRDGAPDGIPHPALQSGPKPSAFPAAHPDPSLPAEAAG